jgi:predicted oxidoreductase
MGIGGSWDRSPLTAKEQSHSFDAIHSALEHGINLFDHADIYKFGKAEEAFGRFIAQSPEVRDSIYIQSKCGIRLPEAGITKQYDFSTEWVETSVNGILSRLNTEYLDVLLMHRPDPLVEWEELANTLNSLHQAGKINHIGVSNMSATQITRLQTYLNVPIVCNQLEMSLAKSDFVKQGISLPYSQAQYVAGTVEHCDEHNIQLQAWGCISQGQYSERGLESENATTRNTAQYVAQLAADYQVSSEAIVLAFLMRHPSNIQPVIGTANPARIKACTDACDVVLTREQWYKLLELSLGHEVP